VPKRRNGQAKYAAVFAVYLAQSMEQASAREAAGITAQQG